MVKPEWGTKRTCLSCGAKFYDLLKQPIICPKCETEFEPAAKPRRTRAYAPRPAPTPVKKVAPVAAVKDDDDDDDLLADDDDDDAAEPVIEDTSDLEGGDDAIAEVPVAVDDDKEET